VADTGSIVSGIAGRYALALFELAVQENAVDAVSTQLDKFESLLAGSSDLTDLIKNPTFSAGDQVRAINAVLDKAKIAGIGANFIRLVASKRRLFAVSSMITAYRSLVARERGEVTAHVTVAEALNDKNKASVQAALDAATGKKVTLVEKIDPSIIGGLIVRLGSKMVDSSVRTKLNSIKLAMKEAG
jgi:F-type H+-transporting ATPase subunit delta